MFIVCSILFFNSELPIGAAKYYTLKLDYEYSNKILHTINELNPNTYNDYHYYSVINYFALNDKRGCERHVNMLTKSFVQLPRRQEVMLGLIIQSLEAWKNDLGDIARLMKLSEDKLNSVGRDNTTDKTQKDIIDKLDRIIKEKEEAKLRPISLPNLPNSRPLPDSKIVQELTKGTISESKIKEYSKNWGTLPVKEREKIVQQILIEIPQKYRREVELYYKTLNKSK